MLLYKRKSKKVAIKYELVQGSEAYGVKAEMTVDGDYLESSMIKEMFTDVNEAMLFLRFLAKNGIEPCHLEDVASDYYC